MATELIEVTIVAADHPVWSGKATSVTIPAYAGLMGILPNHEPLLTLIQDGTVTAVDEQGERHEFQVSGGFISFDSNRLTVAVERGQDVQRR